MEKKLVLEMKGICKSFGETKALTNAMLKAYAGNVTALMGENGAGKSTLMKILSGVYSKDSGDVIFNGKDVEYLNPKDSQKNGISIIHQELNLFSNLNIWENIFLGRELKKGFSIDKDKMRTETTRLIDKLGLTLNPNTLIEDLSVGQQQMIEIAKALSFKSKVIIFDEPTSSLSLKETEALFHIIEDLKAQDMAIIYISHRMEEIFQISDNIIVLRDGCYIDHVDTQEVNEDRLIELMVGRKISDQYPKVECEVGKTILEVKNLTTTLAKNQSFEIKEGEITVFTGLVGGGRTELAHSIYGLAKIVSGSIYLDGEKLKIHKPSDAIKYGIKYISEDRKGDGLILDMSIKHNTTISGLQSFTSFGIQINHNLESRTAKELNEDLKVKSETINKEIGLLSGGNQQKVAFARILEGKKRLVILDEPTRGVDVGAKREIYNLINMFKKNNIGVMVISSDMGEVLGIADKIIVMANNKITATLDPKVTTSEKIMTHAIQF